MVPLRMLRMPNNAEIRNSIRLFRLSLPRGLEWDGNWTKNLTSLNAFLAYSRCDPRKEILSHCQKYSTKNLLKMWNDRFHVESETPPAELKRTRSTTDSTEASRESKRRRLSESHLRENVNSKYEHRGKSADKDRTSQSKWTNGTLKQKGLYCKFTRIIQISRIKG